MESHFARRQAEATARQANVIMFFTFITIFFVSAARASVTILKLHRLTLLAVIAVPDSNLLQPECQHIPQK
jgi:hypothetical protein